MKNVLELLEASRDRFPDKTVFADEAKSVSYTDFTSAAKRLGTAVARLGFRRRPVAVLLPRCVEDLEAAFGVVYSGNFYVIIDSEMPEDRIKSIFQTLSPACLVYAEALSEKAASLGVSFPALCFEEAVKSDIDGDILAGVRRSMTDADPLYALFTSGSTGVPKGCVVSHGNVISYTKWYSDCFGIDENTVFGSQTPFYFSMSVSDVFSTIRCGATLQIIPKTLFSFPINLIGFLNERRVNTIYWVPSALCIIANWKVLDYKMTEYLNKVLFAGEVMPVRQLRYWREKLPGALFANLFGPTETTDICTYYVVDRDFDDGETLPIGRACDNCEVFILKDDGTPAAVGEEGELYARGAFVAMGYYNNPEKTAAAFVQNPLNKAYPETVYKTGDLVKMSESGEILYITRKDFQIKHMGYRIELGEIEAACGACEKITSCAALYDSAEDKIVLVYQGKVDAAGILDAAGSRLPQYMTPNVFVRTKSMPINQNGKIDRKWLGANYKTLLETVKK